MPQLTIQFDKKIERVIDGLAEAKGVNAAEILRRSLASYAFLQDECQEGGKVAIINDKERTWKVVNLP